LPLVHVPSARPAFRQINFLRWQWQSTGVREAYDEPADQAEPDRT
jgi:hypothetical protein